MMLCESDERLVNDVVDIWISSGGDAVGFYMVSSEICERIQSKWIEENMTFHTT